MRHIHFFSVRAQLRLYSETAWALAPDEFDVYATAGPAPAIAEPHALLDLMGLAVTTIMAHGDKQAPYRSTRVTQAQRSTRCVIR